VGLATLVWLALTVVTAPAPMKVQPFSLPRLGPGPRVTVPLVGADARHPVVLTFFASWCPPCHRELPKVAGVARRAQATGDRVRFVGIDGDDAPASGLAFARRSGVDFPVGRDALTEIAPRFGVQGYPATVFIDAQGDVVSIVRGPISVSALRAGVGRLDGS
jgi:thiol-disulfide isomerase/thioredoxin